MSETFNEPEPEPDATFLKFTSTGLANLLNARPLRVPFYQRSYSWHTEYKESGPVPHKIIPQDGRYQVNEFWDDITRNFEQRRNYFVGTIVVSNDDPKASRASVIDGQQRLATTSILMAAARDAFALRGVDEYAQSTQNEFVGRFDRAEGERAPRLILNVQDRGFFKTVILGARREASPIEESEKLLDNAYTFFRSKIEHFVVSQGSGGDRALDELVTFVATQVQAVVIDVRNEGEAFQIFETLNDRGADLTIADLLKNYIFSEAGADNIAEAIRNWEGTLAALNISKVGNKRFTDFTRHLINSRYHRTREKELYSRIRSKVRGKAQAIQFSRQLRVAAPAYNALLVVDSDFWGEYSETARKSIEALLVLGAEQYRPLALAALDSDWSKAEIERLLLAIVSWVTRGTVVGTFGGGSAEGAFNVAAMAINSGAARSVEDILKLDKVIEVVPNDPTFQLYFKDFRATKSALARYLLRELELAERGEKEPMLVVNKNAEELNLEHILPKSPTKREWPRFRPEEAQVWSPRLGNMCLLQKGRNGQLGNKAWRVKRAAFAESELRLTERLSRYAEWTPDSIAENQEHLAALALRVWPIKPI